jgi:hypothetical protein
MNTTTEIQAKLNASIGESRLNNMNRDYSKIRTFVNNTDFLSTPAAAKHHNNFPSGLALHVLNFTEALEILMESFKGKIKVSPDDFDPFLVALGHDLNKVGFYTITDYNKKINGNWVNLLQYGYNNALDTMPSNSVSLSKMKSLIELSEAEALAIYWCEGNWSTHNNQPLNKAWDNAVAYDHRVYLAHTADMIASRMMERTLNDLEVNQAIRNWV